MSVLKNQKNYLKILSNFLNDSSVITLFKKFFYSNNKEIILLAIEKASESKNKEFIKELKPFLNSKDREIVISSAVALIKLGEKNIVSSIEEYIESSDITENCAAIKAFSEIEQKNNRKYLKKFLNNNDDRIKKELMNFFTKINDDTACKLALREITRSNEKMLSSSIKVLKNFHFYSDIIKLLYSKNETIRILAIGALKDLKIDNKKIEIEYQTALLKNMDEENEMLTLSAIGALNFPSEKALKKLIEKWKIIHPFYKKNVEEAIIRILKCDENNFNIFYNIIEKFVISFILSIFKKVNNRDFFVAFRRAGNNFSSFEKYKAIIERELKDIKKSEILNEEINVLYFLFDNYLKLDFIDNLKKEIDKINVLSDIEFKYSKEEKLFISVIINIFSNLGNNKINDLIGILLYSDNSNIVESAINITGKLKLKKYEHVFEKFLNIKETRKLLGTIRTLGQLKSEMYLKQINYCFNSDDPAVRREILISLNKISGSRNIFIFYKSLKDSSDIVKKTAIKILENDNSHKTETVLLNEIDNNSDMIKLCIIDILLRKGNLEVLERLIEIIDNSKGEILKKAIDIALNLKEEIVIKKLFNLIDKVSISYQNKLIEYFKKLDLEEITKYVLPLCGNFFENIKILNKNNKFVKPDNKIIDFFEKRNLTDVYEIASGGMGKILRAFNRETREYVAIKMLIEKYKEDVQALKRFLKQDGYMVMGLDHPNIIKVFEVNSKEIPYILMEYIDGKTIKTLIKEKGKLPEKIAIKIIYQVCKALDYAHNNNVIHRDIKPDNIMLDRKKNVKIMDFGLAKITGQTTMTRTGEIFGTIHYMPPEQIKKGEIDQRTDIYALGVTMYEILTGKLPYDGESPEQIIYQVFYDSFDTDSLNKNNISDKTKIIINKCMKKEKEERYQTVKEIIDDIGI